MNVKFPSEDENIEYEDELAEQGPIKNKQETSEIRCLQKEIKGVISKVDQEKKNYE